MGCCMPKESEKLIVKSHYRGVSTFDTDKIVKLKRACMFCNERIPHAYVFVVECTVCHSIGHSECVQQWKQSTSSKLCPFCIV
jgi:hypothetical protein